MEAFKVRKIVDEMMLDRQCVIKEKSKLYPYFESMTQEDLQDLIKTAQGSQSKEVFPEDFLSSVYISPEKPGSTQKVETYVIFIPTKTEENKKSIVKFTDRLNIFMKSKLIKTSDRIIIVSEIKLGTNHIKGVLGQWSNIDPEYFIFSDLYINPTKHKYVPRHEFLSDTETKSIFSNINVKDLSVIKKSDPIVRWFGALPNQIVRIHRVNFTVDTMIDESFYYRIVSFD